MTSFTVGQLLDIVTRAKSVIEESEGADEHGALLTELGDLADLLSTEIGGSHVGCAADVVLVERSDSDPEPTSSAQALSERGRKCGECLMGAVEIVTLNSDGVCPRCGANYGRA